MVAGYAHPRYAKSFSEFGTPRRLPRSGGWILERQIPGFSYRDAMGCYPLFSCQDWSLLHADLDALGDDLVALALVTDPFGEYDEVYLRRCFRDTVRPFKDHFIVDLSRPRNEIGSRHHRYYARRALKEVQVHECGALAQFTEEWSALYENLIARRDIEGIQAFSRTAFAEQLTIPGMVMFRALYQGIAIGAQLWFVQGEVGYSHLSAFSEVGYKLRASYALQGYAIDQLADRVRWLNLGGGAGLCSDGLDGLSLFKRGWSTGTRPAYFCGRIFHHARYEEIVARKGISSIDYFPAYRRGEFT